MKKTFLGNNQFSGTVEDRFWQKVSVGKSDECWEWQATKHHQWGYGSATKNGRFIAAHRLSWEIHFGEIPKDMCVCHKCDNPPCVNPNHLFLGTIADNNLDKKNKGRQSDNIGSNNNRARLKENDIVVIRSLRRQGVSGAEIGRRYGVVKEAIYDICSGKRWGHIKEGL